MLHKLVVLASLVAVASSIACYTCDSFISCANPVLETCPPSTQCYTVQEQTGEVLFRGCTLSCNSLGFLQGGQLCSTCSYEKCNYNPGGGHPAGPRQFENYNNNRLQKKKRNIGGGTQYQPNYGQNNGGGMNNAYGNGQQPGQQPHRHHHNHGNLGSGAQPHNIGHGASAGGHLGSGAGIRHRRSGGGTFIGGGARPTNYATSTLLAMPLTVILARILA